MIKQSLLKNKNKNKKKHLLIALFGSFLEYFDYALYGFLGYQIAETFFPSENTTLSMIKAYAIFATSHFAKPFGAFFFGWLGDKFGRVVSLRYTLLGIAAPTFIIGILPGYESWGISSVILLLLCRFAQGFFIVGEYDGAALYLMEHFEIKGSVFANSLLSTFAMLGIGAASFAVMLLREINGFESYLWRAPFLFGGILAIIMLYLRSSLIETPFFKKLKKEPYQPLTYKFFFSLWKPLLLAAMVCGMVGGLYHFTFIFMEKFLMNAQGILLSKLHFYALLLYIIATPFMGLLGDKIGASKLFTLGFIASLSHWSVLYTHLEINFYKIWLFSASFALSALAAPAYALLLELLPDKSRYRVLSLGHALGSMLFSGTAPMFGFLFYQIGGAPQKVFLYPILLLTATGFSLVFSRARLPFAIIWIQKRFAKTN